MTIRPIEREHGGLRRLAGMLLAAGILLAAPALGNPPTSSAALPDGGNPILEAPAIDAQALRTRDKTTGSPEKVLRFAEPYLVGANTSSHGLWEALDDGQARWSLYVVAPGATDINIGFTNFFLPPGCVLRLTAADGAGRAGPYTAADNNANRQFWTPVIPGDTILIEAELPLAEAGALVLEIAAVNRGYLDLGRKGFFFDEKQGACNIDVVCPEAAAWRDESRGVGRYTISGAYLCTGTLVMNQRADFRPFFLTANHCVDTTTEAASVVVYWNYEAPTCGTLGGGSLGQNQSGSTLRATYAASDFTLLELNSAPNAAFNVYYAGWDCSGGAVNAAVGIHHPSGAVKAYCQENQALTSTDYLSATVNAGANHWRVIDWDLGTTEGGSSGSGLWNTANRRIVGQLHGGYAACGNDLSDWYGKLSVSWAGGGTSATRLRDWLDPDNTSLTGMNGQFPTNAPTGLPDFIIQSIALSPSTVTNGQAMTATIIVKNQGTLSGNAGWLDLWIDKPTAPTGEIGDAFASVGTLAAGETRTYTHNFAAPAVGARTYRAYVDSENGTQEGNENNNQATMAYTVNSGTVASLTISPENRSHTAAAVSGQSIGVTANVAWTAVANHAWITVTGGASGSNNGTVTYSVAANTGAARAGTITIAGGGITRTFTINQAAAATVSLNQALDAQGFSWGTGGNASWFGQAQVTYDGTDAARSGAIGNNQQSWMQTTVTGPGTLSFWWRVSSEYQFDYLRLHVGNTERAAISGNVNWQHRSVTLDTGTHTLRWTYSKDGSVEAGMDAGFVDKITWLPNGGIWSGAWDFGNGWKYIDWFGYFYTAHHPWVYHEHHGWLYSWGSTPDSMIFWDHTAKSYWWTSNAEYPRVYRYSDSAYLWYQQGSQNPRWFYNTANGQWESW